MYHYTGGVALAALKRWKEAEEHLEICVTSPGTYPAALQMEALKKLRLVQLIARGTVPPLPKYTHPQLLRLFKNTPYNAFVNAYPRNGPLMREIYDKERQKFSQVRPLYIDFSSGCLERCIGSKPWIVAASHCACASVGAQETHGNIRYVAPFGYWARSDDRFGG
jgi:hypothetical protein